MDERKQIRQVVVLIATPLFTEIAGSRCLDQYVTSGPAQIRVVL